MKFLLVLFVVLVGVWVWRSNRAVERPPSRRAKPPADGAVDMVGCDLCGLHCPRGDLVVGGKGVYCCTQHQHQAEA
jgi:uncharacterized protein